MNLGSAIFNKFAIRGLRDGKITLLIAKAFAYDPEKTKIRPLQWARAEPGDFAWIQEPWTFFTNKSGEWCEIAYDADFDGPAIAKTKTRWTVVSRVLKRHAKDMALADSRFSIEVLGVRIIRAGELTEDDVRKAGVFDKINSAGAPGYGIAEDPYLFELTPIGAFKKRWINVRGRDAWSEHMKLAIVHFELHRENITKFCTIGRRHAAARA